MNPNNNKTAECNEEIKNIPISNNQNQRAPHPAGKFAGIYELAEIDNPDFKPGDLRRYEHCDNYEIVTLDEDKIWFSDFAEIFEDIEVFTLNELKQIANGYCYSVVVVEMQNEKLVIMEIDDYYQDGAEDGNEDDRRSHQISRVHILSGEDLVVIDEDSWSKGPAIYKKYARINK